MKIAAGVREEWNGNCKTKVGLGGEGCRPALAQEEAIVQWIKVMKYDDSPLKTVQVTQFWMKEYGQCSVPYLMINNEDSLHSFVRQFIYRNELSFRQEQVLSTIGSTRRHRPRSYASKTHQRNWS